MPLVMIGAVEPYGVTIKTMPHPIQSVHLRLAEGAKDPPGPSLRERSGQGQDEGAGE